MNEELKNAADNHIRKVTDAGWEWTTEDIADAFIAGAKWQAEHTPLPEDTVLFNKGVEEGKRLMMKEAVEGEVFIANADYKEAIISIVVENTKFDYLETGDKVRIIVLPKEDGK